jgi:hypothetical protein
LHAYEHPLLAVLLNPIHADFPDPILWEAEGGGTALREGQVKIGVTELTTIRQIPCPTVTTEQRVKFAILCAREVCGDKSWGRWADRWLSGQDRSEAAAWAAARSAWAAARSARSASAAEAAAWAAEAAAGAAEEAAEAAAEAARSNPEIGLIAIVERAML